MRTTPVELEVRQSAYHVLTFGWLIGGWIEAGTQQPLKELLDLWLVRPLQLDGVYFGEPEDRLERCAELTSGLTGVPVARSNLATYMSALSGRVATALGYDLNEFRNAMNPFVSEFDWNRAATALAKFRRRTGTSRQRR